MLKIGILTFHCAKNYGAILQAYALRSLLTHLSPAADTTIINYRPDSLILPYIPQLMLPAKYDLGVKNKPKEFLRRLLSIKNTRPDFLSYRGNRNIYRHILNF